MSFNGSDYKENAGFTPKILTPGTSYCRIIDVKLEPTPYNAEAFSVVLMLEGMDQGNEFQGIAIDKLNPSLGNYRGQVANVRNGKYPFSTYTFNGKTIDRDLQIFNWVNGLLNQMGLAEQRVKLTAATIQDYVQEARKLLINPELWGMFTIGGQEYFTEGYANPNYRLYFPKVANKKYPYSAILEEDGTYKALLPYDAAEHIAKAKEETSAAEVTSFDADSAPTIPSF